MGKEGYFPFLFVGQFFPPIQLSIIVNRAKIVCQNQSGIVCVHLTPIHTRQFIVFRIVEIILLCRAKAKGTEFEGFFCRFTYTFHTLMKSVIYNLKIRILVKLKLFSRFDGIRYTCDWFISLPVRHNLKFITVSFSITETLLGWNGSRVYLGPNV